MAKGKDASDGKSGGNILKPRSPATTDKVLKALKSAAGEFLTIEQICKKIGADPEVWSNVCDVIFIGAQLESQGKIEHKNISEDGTAFTRPALSFPKPKEDKNPATGEPIPTR